MSTRYAPRWILRKRSANILLDTRVLIWVLSDNPAISGRIRSLIVDGENIIFVSAVTAWEISIKRSIGKLQAPDNYDEALVSNRFISLEISSRHALGTEKLPFHHQDPFDRLLISQARDEKLTVLTHDKVFQKYEVDIVLC